MCEQCYARLSNTPQSPHVLDENLYARYDDINQVDNAHHPIRNNPTLVMCSRGLNVTTKRHGR
jgi:hypothetical protein